jgi:hypothetical protein
MVEPLQSVWGQYIERLDTGGYELLADERAHIDEIALALALLETAVPLELLGPEWNFRGRGLASASTLVRIAEPGAIGTVAGGPAAGRPGETAVQNGLARDLERLNVIVEARRSQTPHEGPGALVAEAAQLAAQAVRQIGRPSSRDAGL